MNCTHCAGEFSGMEGASIFTGRLASHNPPAWGPSVRDLDIILIQGELGALTAPIMYPSPTRVAL